MTADRQEHDQMVAAVIEALKGKLWKVVEEPNAIGPDIIATDPDGAPYVFEIKTGSTAAHLGAVAQVEAYRNSLSDRWGARPKGVLIFSSEAPEQLNEVARLAEVELVHASPDKPEVMLDSLDTVGA